MNSEYEIIQYTPEWKKQAVELQTHLWNPDVAVNTSYLEWKYERNPYVTVPFIYLALHQGRVVGMWGLHGAQCQGGLPCHTWPSLCGGDLVVAPDHRGRGLYPQLMRAAVQDLAGREYPYIYSMSPSPAAYPGGLAMGWHSLGPLGIVQRKAHLSSSIFPLHLLDRYKRQRRQVQVSLEDSPRPQVMAEVVERLGTDGRIRQVRDQQYFDWRFQNPRSSYQFLFWQDTRVEGYMVLQEKRDKAKGQVNIVDWEATNAQVRADLLRAAIRWGHFAALNVWTVSLSDEVKALLLETGFKLLAEPAAIPGSHPTLMVMPVRDDMLETEWRLAGRRILDLADWDLRMIYSDSY